MDGWSGIDGKEKQVDGVDIKEKEYDGKEKGDDGKDKRYIGGYRGHRNCCLGNY